jgi:hypothetical protein
MAISMKIYFKNEKQAEDFYSALYDGDLSLFDAATAPEKE